MKDFFFYVILAFVLGVAIGLVFGNSINTQTQYIIIDKNKVLETVVK